MQKQILEGEPELAQVQAPSSLREIQDLYQHFSRRATLFRIDIAAEAAVSSSSSGASSGMMSPSLCLWALATTSDILSAGTRMCFHTLMRNRDSPRTRKLSSPSLIRIRLQRGQFLVNVHFTTLIQRMHRLPREVFGCRACQHFLETEHVSQVQGLTSVRHARRHKDHLHPTEVLVHGGAELRGYVHKGSVQNHRPPLHMLSGPRSSCRPRNSRSRASSWSTTDGFPCK